MESLENLKAQLRDAKEELEKITIKKHGSVPWDPGVMDQYESKSYSPFLLALTSSTTTLTFKASLILF